MSTKPSQAEAPLYLICYDISDNKERSKVDKILHDYGFRVQKSVYECHLTRGDKQRLLGTLESLNLTTGHIRCYSIAHGKVHKIGNVPDEIDDEYIYFIE